MKNTFLKPSFWILFIGAWVSSCKDSFLDVPAKGSLGTPQLLSQAGVENILIGAYSALKANGPATVPGSWSGNSTNWVYGSVCGQETFKGSDSGDQSDINPLSNFTASPANAYLLAKWGSVYDGVTRSNNVLKTLAQVTTGISDADRTRITAEARFLRGFFHFEAYKVFHYVPYIDETVDYSKGNYNVANDKDIMPNIIADFDFAAQNLAETMPSVGRANKWAAKAFQAKCLLYQKNFAAALTIFNDIIANGKTAAGTKYALLPKFRDVFDASHDNSSESVFAIQGSVNDGSGAANADAELVLNYPYGGNSVVTCCGFNTPTLDMANSYRLNGLGLPILDGTHNSVANQISDVKWTTGGTAANVRRDSILGIDPRIDWTLGRTGVPFLDWALYRADDPAAQWTRNAGDDGPYTPKKYDPLSADVGTYTDKSSWTPGYTAVNLYLMRFADVLLMAAECEVESGSLANAMALVNQVRARQQNSASWVRIDASNVGIAYGDKNRDPKKDWTAYTTADPTASLGGNYLPFALYGTGGDVTFATKTMARRAVHMERKLELCLEGHRFFDLVRWGETTNTNANGAPDNLEAAFVYNVAHSGAGALGNVFKFQVGRDEQWPIPQSQIDLSQGTLKQMRGQ